MKKDKKFLCKGELKCDFINHNTTSENIEDGYYWFTINGYLFTHCWVEVIGWGENVTCQTGSYYLEKK